MILCVLFPITYSIQLDDLQLIVSMVFKMSAKYFLSSCLSRHFNAWINNSLFTLFDPSLSVNCIFFHASHSIHPLYLPSKIPILPGVREPCTLVRLFLLSKCVHTFRALQRLMAISQFCVAHANFKSTFPLASSSPSLSKLWHSS